MKFISHSVKETLNIGKKIAQKLKKGDMICLFGELGSGKTVLAKGIASGLGIKTSKIISPTFVLIREHKGKFPFYHFDLYRLRSPQDILILGYEEYFYSEGVSVIEWPERLEYLLPKEFLKVELSVHKEEEKRALKITSLGKRYEEVLSGIKSKQKAGKKA